MSHFCKCIDWSASPCITGFLRRISLTCQLYIRVLMKCLDIEYMKLHIFVYVTSKFWERGNLKKVTVKDQNNRLLTQEGVPW